MKRWQLAVLVGGMLSLPFAGCSEPTVEGIPHTHDAELEVTLCGHCGEMKGSETCCKEGATECAACGLQKDSALCCSSSIEGVRDVVLCRKCGEKRFTDACCSDGAAKCEKCGLQKGSPGCCKIDKLPIELSTTVAHAHEESQGH